MVSIIDDETCIASSREVEDEEGSLVVVVVVVVVEDEVAVVALTLDVLGRFSNPEIGDPTEDRTGNLLLVTGVLQVAAFPRREVFCVVSAAVDFFFKHSFFSRASLGDVGESMSVL